MRITHLIPGTGHFYCGSCLRDHCLVRGLRRRGHDVTAVPLYLPMVLEEAPTRQDEQRILMGGINMYLQQKSRLFGHLPRLLARLLDRPGLLRWLAGHSHMTDPADLGDMTLSLLRGESGRQSHELDQLVAFLAEHDPPELICLSNIMLSGMARRLKELDVPIVCTLQGEAPFLDALPEAAREEAWRLVRERARDIDAFIPVSCWYGKLMGERLDLDPERVHVVHNGIDLDGVAEPPAARGDGPPTIGYLARLCPDKGLHTLVEAFRILRESGRVPGARLAVAGTMLKEDRPYVERLRRALRDAGLDGEATFAPNLDRDAKWRFLHGLSALSVPATYGESFGLYVVEALASGVPVVQPRHGAFPELLELTGGGLLCEPDDPDSLAGALADLLSDPDRARSLGESGRAAVHERFGADRMAQEVEKVYMMAPRCRTSTR